MPRLDTQKQRLLFVWHSRLQPVKYMVILALLLLTWFETVSTCLLVYILACSTTLQCCVMCACAGFPTVFMCQQHCYELELCCC
jgi:hypothetical protein